MQYWKIGSGPGVFPGLIHIDAAGFHVIAPTTISESPGQSPLGANMVLAGDNRFTIGMLLAFVSYSSSFSGSIQSLIAKLIEFRFLSLHLERLADITKTEPEISASINDDAREEKFTGEIKLKNISFRYSSSDPWVLRNVSLTINPRDFIVFAGPSGGGKTTLLKLIIGLYSPTEGEILIEGKPLTQATMASWRNRVGVVMQDDRLMSGSIADNISFFDSNLDMKLVKKVAQDALINEEIMAMPMNYLSFIGDMGSALSGGQKQRIFLARAFYRKPEILCLDEGTARPQLIIWNRNRSVELQLRLLLLLFSGKNIA